MELIAVVIILIAVALFSIPEEQYWQLLNNFINLIKTIWETAEEQRENEMKKVNRRLGRLDIQR